MFLGASKPKEPQVNNFEEGVQVQEYDMRNALPGALPVGAVRIPLDKLNELPPEIQRQIQSVDFSETKLQPKLKEAVEGMQNLQKQAVTNAPLGQAPTLKYEDIKKVSYTELLPEQRAQVNDALNKFAQFVEENSKQRTEDGGVIADGQLKFESLEDFNNHVARAWTPETIAEAAAPIEQAAVEPEIKQVPPARTETKQQTEPPMETEPVICPHCFRNTRQPVQELTQLQKQNFLISVASSKPYTETISLFGGNIVIKLKTINLDETDLFNIMVDKLQSDNGIPDNTKSTIDTRILLTLYLEKLTINNISVTLPDIIINNNNIDESCQQVYRRFDKIKEACPSLELLRTLSKECVEFYDRYIRMLSLASNENFWKPTSL